MLFNAQNITFSYPHSSFEIREVSFSGCQGEIIALVGHNGAGKTTLMKLLGGVLTPSCGIVDVEDRSVGSVAYVPDAGGFYPKLTVAANASLFQKISKQGDVGDSAYGAVVSVGLEQRWHDRAKTLSHGMKRRLALACACASHPSLALLDEALNGVDPESRDAALSFLRRLAGEGSCIVISTHDLDLVKELCSRMVVLDEGRLVSDESVAGIADVHERYRELTGRWAK